MKQDGRFSNDPRGYMKRKNAERRARCRAAGLCTHCSSEPARTGRILCSGCAEAARQRFLAKAAETLITPNL